MTLDESGGLESIWRLWHDCADIFCKESAFLDCLFQTFLRYCCHLCVLSLSLLSATFSSFFHLFRKQSFLLFLSLLSTTTFISSILKSRFCCLFALLGTSCFLLHPLPNLLQSLSFWTWSLILSFKWPLIAPRQTSARARLLSVEIQNENSQEYFESQE